MIYVSTGKQRVKEAAMMVAELKALDGTGGHHYPHKADGSWKSQAIPQRGGLGIVISAECSACGRHIHAGVI